MTFFYVLEPEKIDLPAKYSKLTRDVRWLVRDMYIDRQGGKCYHCNGCLKQPAPDFIMEKRIDRDLFPPDFFKHPVHLHHDHNTDLTIGAVHCHCNAVLWQYHGE
jgi:hypothetical protein